jgi:hypothetical protein
MNKGKSSDLPRRTDARRTSALEEIPETVTKRKSPEDACFTALSGLYILLP